MMQLLFSCPGGQSLGEVRTYTFTWEKSWIHFPTAWACIESKVLRYGAIQSEDLNFFRYFQLAIIF